MGSGRVRARRGSTMWELRHYMALTALRRHPESSPSGLWGRGPGRGCGAEQCQDLIEKVDQRSGRYRDPRRECPTLGLVRSVLDG